MAMKSAAAGAAWPSATTASDRTSGSSDGRGERRNDMVSLPGGREHTGRGRRSGVDRRLQSCVMAAGPRVLELYCGIGGCAAALPSGAEVVAALDISEPALAVYRRNFPHAAAACTLESLRGDDPRLRHADLWWLSPPCQPFTRRGRGDDVDDPRSASFLHLLTLVARVRPPLLALENVPQFLGSRAHARLRAVLDDGGYDVRERLLCPTELGVPNRRRRFYLVASRAGFATEAPAGVAANATSAPAVARSLATYLDAEDDPALLVDERLLARYAHAIDVVEAADAGAVAATFTAAYGRSPV